MTKKYSSFSTCGKRRNRTRIKYSEHQRIGLCIYFRKSNKVLFLKKRKLHAISPTKLEIPSGKKESIDRDIKDAMIREAREELLVDIDKIKLGDSYLVVPDIHIFNKYWNNILKKKNISHLKYYTREQTKASEFTIGCIAVDSDIPSEKIRNIHDEIYKTVSTFIFGGDTLLENYLEYKNWNPCIKHRHKHNELWKYLEATRVEYISLDTIPSNKNLNFKTFWKKGIIYLQSNLTDR